MNGTSGADSRVTTGAHITTTIIFRWAVGWRGCRPGSAATFQIAVEFATVQLDFLNIIVQTIRMTDAMQMKYGK